MGETRLTYYTEEIGRGVSADFRKFMAEFDTVRGHGAALIAFLGKFPGKTIWFTNEDDFHVFVGPYDPQLEGQGAEVFVSRAISLAQAFPLMWHKNYCPNHEPPSLQEVKRQAEGALNTYSVHITTCSGVVGHACVTVEASSKEEAERIVSETSCEEGLYHEIVRQLEESVDIRVGHIFDDGWEVDEVNLCE